MITTPANAEPVLRSSSTAQLRLATSGCRQSICDIGVSGDLVALCAESLRPARNMSDDGRMHQAVCGCSSPMTTTNGTSKHTELIAELHQVLSDLLGTVISERSFMFPEQQDAVWRAKAVLAKTRP